MLTALLLLLPPAAAPLPAEKGVPDRYFVYVRVPFEVDGTVREAFFVRDYDTEAEARQKNAGEDVKLFWRGRQLSLQQIPPDPNDGSRYYLNYCYQPDGRNDYQVMEVYESRDAMMRGLLRANQKPGFHDPRLRMGHELQFKP